MLDLVLPAPPPSLVIPTSGQIVRLVLPALHKMQALVVNDPHRIVVAAMGSKWGKTYGMSNWLIRKAWNNYQSVNWWCAPSYRQARIAQNLMLQLIPVPRRRLSRTEMVIELLRTNGTPHSRIEFRSADRPETLRGEGVHHAVADEGGFWKYDAWVSLWTTLSRTRGMLRLITTPKGRNYVYDEWVKGSTPEMRLLHPEYMSYRCPTHDNPYVPRESLEEFKRNLPEKVYRQEICLLPSTPVKTFGGPSKPVGSLSPGDAVPHWDGQALVPCRVLASRSTGKAFVVGVRLETGETLEASVGHRFKTADGPCAIEDLKHACLVPDVVPSRTQEHALARLVGFNIGDGTIAEGTFGVGFYAKYKDDLGAVADDCRLAGIGSPSVRLKKLGPRTAGLIVIPADYEFYQVQLGRKTGRMLAASGVPVGKKVRLDFEVPQWIRDSPDPQVRAEFLAGLFGAEGSTPRFSGRKCRPPSLTMYKQREHDGERFFAQLVEMLTEQGVSATCNLRRRPPTDKSYGKGYAEWCYELAITGSDEGTMQFGESVGFRYAHLKTVAQFEAMAYIKAYRFYAEQSGISRADHGFPGGQQWIQERRTVNGLRLDVVDQYFIGTRDVWNITVDSPDHSYVLGNGINTYNCAEFLDESAGVLSNFRQVQANTWLNAPVKNGVYVMGIDWAKHENYTVFTIGDRTSKHIVHFERFTAMDWNSQIDRAIRVAKAWNNAHIIMDSTGVGDVPFDMVRAVYSNCEGYQISNNAAKVPLIQKLQLAFERAELRIPNFQTNAITQQMQREVEMFGYVISPQGKFLYSAPEGYQDDIVMSMALCWWVLGAEPFVYKFRQVRGV